jgi:hypothetical protein
MTTQTSTLSMTGQNTGNSRNAGTTPGIAFGTHIPPRTAPISKCNSNRTASDDPCGPLNGVPGDDDFGDNRTGNGDPDDPDNEGPDDPINNPDNSKHGIQNNLADAITALARNVQH